MADYEQVGEFDTQAEVDEWARRNGIDYRDISTLHGRKISVSVRRSATRMSDRELRENSRKNGFF